MKGYEGGHNSCNNTESKRAAEDAQKDAEGLQHGHGLKAVAVVTCRLVRHNGAAGKTESMHAKPFRRKKEVGLYYKKGLTKEREAGQTHAHKIASGMKSQMQQPNSKNGFSYQSHH